jgi:putative transposase
MPRKARFTLPGIPQHIIQRGNNREPCFYSEEDYRRYLDELQDVASKFDCRVHAYVLMTNNVHLLVTPRLEHGISQMMQALGRRYVYCINTTYKRTGTLWEGRYRSSLIDSDHYLFVCMRYIELKPVRASMIEHPGDYQWSSYPANAQGVPDPLIEVKASKGVGDKTQSLSFVTDPFLGYVTDPFLALKSGDVSAPQTDPITRPFRPG